MISHHEEDQKRINLERATTLGAQEVVNNLEQQEHQEGTRGTTILKDLQPKG